MRRTAAMTIAPCPIALLLAALVLSSPSVAAPTYANPFNEVSLLDNRPNDGGGLSIASGKRDDAAEVSQSRVSLSNLAGSADGYAYADYGQFKALLRVTGSITDQVATARSNEWFTISDSNVPIGTDGLMQMGFVISGDATVHDADGAGVPGDNWVHGSLLVFKDQTQTSLGMEQGSTAVSLVNGGAVVPGSGPGHWVVSINFDYGIPFNVTTVFQVSVHSDATFTFLANGNLVKTGGIIDLIEADFSHSANLNRVFIPVGASLSAASPFDYTPLVRFGTAPVPLPPAFWMMGSALALLGAGKVRRAVSSVGPSCA